MFARWRNLAAAAGAIWFPLASALGSLDRSELRYDTPCTRPGACAGYHDHAANPWQTYDRESWYQQYYRNSVDDPTSITDQPENPPRFENDYTTGNDDDFSDTYAPDFTGPEFPMTDEPAAVLEPRIEEVSPVIDSDGRCDDATCPCHDVIDLDSDDDSTPPSAASFGDRLSPAEDSRPGCLDVDGFDYYGGEFDEEPMFGTTPAARLTGTIEPLFEDCDEAAIDDSFDQSVDSTVEFDTNLDAVDSTATDELAGEAIEEAQEATEEFGDDAADSVELNSRFHMFYPGCDWSPYQPVECERRPAAAVEPVETTPSEEDSFDSQPSFFEID
jgi:hypothetical protein